MATEVLLMKDVPLLGTAGSVVRVAEGYARNCLLPRGWAEPVTKAAMRRLEKLRKERLELDRLQLAEAREKAEKLAKVSCTLRSRTADGRKLYGSISASDIVEALAAENIALVERQVRLDTPIKELGAFDVTVKLHPEVSVTIKLWVVEE